MSYLWSVATIQKRSGAYYTPEDVAQCLVRWVVRGEDDRLLDPSCGDGRFLCAHSFSVGIEQDGAAAALARSRAPGALVHTGDFFTWAAQTDERFECVAGNPPFIRYQTFSGETRKRAQRLCSSLGAEFSGLASSWAPFLVAAASLLKPGGRLAFVVPAEIGHAPYAVPVLDYLARSFGRVQIVAIREKLFPELSEDCWLLFAERAGEKAESIDLSVLERYQPSNEPPAATCRIDLAEMRSDWNGRLRPYLIPKSARSLYREVADRPGARRLGEIASVGIGYVSGANDFFHLRPSMARRFEIPTALLSPSVRNGRSLPKGTLKRETVSKWLDDDEPVLLLKLARDAEIPRSVKKYLDTQEGLEARTAYKCRMRNPWWSVPDVRTPDLFLTYMSGRAPSLVRNAAGCTGTNSVHHVQLRSFEHNPADVVRQFESLFVQLSCELEGHPLGGGMLKLEPREAGRILLPGSRVNHCTELTEAVSALRAWRHVEDRNPTSVS